jgi:hypothetical protein
VQHLLDWRQRVEGMELIKVDVVRAEPLKARLAGADDLLP